MTPTAVAIEGRDVEVATLLALSRSSHTRGDRAVLVSGDAGIGKTHVARAVAAQLAADGTVVAWGRADPVERAVPYAAISQALASLPGGRWLELDGRHQGQDVVRTEIYRPVAELLEAHCAEGAVAMVVDDLHHADQDTLVLIGFLVRRLVDVPLTWIFTSRPHVAEPTPGLDALLHRLREDGQLDEVVLAPLPAADIARLAEAAVGRPLAEPVRAVIVERSAGNPFFGIQLALSLAEAGVLEGPMDQGRTVPSVSRRVALLERVFPLGERARSVARLASVFGDIDLDRLEGLAAVLGVDVAEVQDGFDRLVRADLLRPVGGRYEFVHDLVRETLYGDLGPAERRRLHSAAARVLLARRAHGDDVDLVELAHHLSMGSPGPHAAAVDALREAGNALARTSPRSAAVQYRRAIEYLPAGGEDAGDLHVRLARALHRAGKPKEVARVCRSGLLGATGDARARLTRYLSAALADEGALGAALAIVDGELRDHGEAAVLLTTRALLNRLLEDYDTAADDIERAEAVARSAAEHLAVLFQRLNLLVDRGAPGGDAPTVLDQLEAMIPSLDPETRRIAHAHVAGACAGFGEIHRGAGHIRAGEALAAQGVADVDWPWTFAARIAIDVAQGRWDDALRTYDEGAAEFTVGLRLTARNHVVPAITDVALARRDLERLQRLSADVVTLTAHGRRVKALAEGKVLQLAGRPAEALTILEGALADAPAGSHLESHLLLGVGSALLAIGGRDAAATVLERVRASVRALGTAWSDVLGNLIELMMCDDAEAGRAGLDAALRLGNLRYEPDFRLHLGRVGVDPATNLPAALQMFTELGCVDSAESAVAEMRRLGLRVPARRRADRFALTDAEQRVAELVADGLSNRAIADRLAYSVKTIEAYLSRIYAKTGCRNRVDLTRRFTVPVP